MNIKIWCWIFKYADEILVSLGSFQKRLEFRLIQVLILFLFYLFIYLHLFKLYVLYLFELYFVQLIN